MKKLFLIFMAAMSMFSCTENEIIVNTERVPCEFHANQFVADVDDVMPITKSDDLREISYQFISVDKTDTVVGTAMESMTFRVNLLKTSYDVKLITDPSVNDLFTNPNITIPINNSRIFNHIETFNVNDMDKGNRKTFTLKHLAGQYVAKVGHIPANHEVVLKVDEFKNGYNWLTGVSSVVDLLPGESSESVFESSKKGNLYSRFVVGGTDIKVKVGIRKTSETIPNLNKIMKLTEYIYTIPKASIRTVTYNINNVNGTDDFIITIDETLTETNEDQQIGKPQK